MGEKPPWRTHLRARGAAATTTASTVGPGGDSGVVAVVVVVGHRRERRHHYSCVLQPTGVKDSGAGGNIGDIPFILASW